MSEQDYILEMKGIDKLFPGVKALDNVDFRVKRGEVHCLIGANGAGKSTLMKVLSGAYVEDAGEIIFDGKVLKPNGTLERKKDGISVIYQELSLVNDLDVGENVFINNYPKKMGVVDWKSVYKQTEEIAKQLNLDIDVRAKVGSLNIGQRQLTEIMKAMASNAKLIVMDEPSATLSKQEFEMLLKVIKDLKAKGITIIYISHHLEELFIVGDRITILKDGKFAACDTCGNLDEDLLVEHMTGVKKDKIKQDEAEIHEISDDVVLELKDLCNKKVSNINLKLHKGEVLGLYGLVGSGRTEIVRSIFGVDPFHSGKIILHGEEVKFKNSHEAINHKIGLVPENRKTQGLVLLLEVWENMTMVALDKFKKNKLIDYKKIETTCLDYKKILNIKTPSIKTVTQNLSGGNQQKVILAKWLLKDCDVLLIDEPTQGIDVMAKEEIYRIIKNLAAEGKSVIVVSSELEELLRICDNISVMYDGKQVMNAGKANFNPEKILSVSVTGRNE